MQMEQLDLEIRSKIYNYTKKILRKYQKGITTGKLTADKFVENIISSGDINDILDEKFLLEKDFKLKDLSKDKFSVIYSLYFILFIFFYILSFFSEKVLNNINFVVSLGWLISLYVLTIDDKRLRGKFNFSLWTL